MPLLLSLLFVHQFYIYTYACLCHIFKMNPEELCTVREFLNFIGKLKRPIEKPMKIERHRFMNNHERRGDT